MRKRFNDYLTTGNVILIVLSLMSVTAFAYYNFPDFFKENTPTIAMVSGTEYISGEYGQIIIRTTDRFGNPTASSNCTATVLYPDKTYFVLDAPMTESSVSGNYYRMFVTPSITGIYEETIVCEIISSGKASILTISSSFHVSVALNIISEISKNQSLYQAALINRLSSLEADITQLSDKVNSMENNISTTMNNNHEDLVSRTESVKNSIDSTNATLKKKFSDFYGDMSNVSRALIGIFVPRE